jgi:hydrogenase nickel incorporation protein HypB
MCGVCGCGQSEIALDRGTGVNGHSHAHHSHDHSHDHPHDHEHSHGRPRDADPGAGNLGGGTLVEIEKSILSTNDRHAEANRRRLADERIFALNLVSSPGAGKTTLLVETVRALSPAFSLGVIEGDQETANDAERIRATGVEAVQINTGRGCHLDAHMVGHALDDLSLSPGGVLFIENVGNLVCPAAFDLGEAAKVVILSVTEGDDKPLKYPEMFRKASVMIVNKTDLLPYVDCDVVALRGRALAMNPSLRVFETSCRTGEGIEAWCDWLRARSAAAG